MWGSAVTGRAVLDDGAVGLQLGVLVDALGPVGRGDPLRRRDALGLDGCVVRVAERAVFVGLQRHGSGLPPTTGQQPLTYRDGVRLVPTPRDVLGVVGRGSDALEQLLAAAPRVSRLLLDVETLLREIGALVARIEDTRASVDGLVGRIDTTAARVAGLLDRLEPPLTALQPVIERLADTTDPQEVDALVALIDHLPGVVGQLERDVLPVLTTLGSVAPDLHDLLDTSRELNGVLARMPGLGLVRRRVEDRQADEVDEVDE